MPEEKDIFLTAAPADTILRVLEFANIYSQQEHTPLSHELLYVLDGKVNLHLEGNLTFQANPGDFLLVPEKMPHRDEFTPLKGLRILLVQFHWNCGEFYKTVNNRSLMQLSYEVRSEARRRLEFMRSRWQNSTLDRLNASIQLHGILLLFYFDLIRTAVPAEDAMPIDEAMHRAKHFIDRNFSEQITLKLTAEHIGISPAYLSRVFHHEYGVSFKKYLNAVRLGEARKLLLNTAYQVGEVAEKCGFSSSSYFIKVFSGYFGVTPKNYAAQVGRSDELDQRS